MLTVTKNMEQLKNQWKKELWLKLFDNFTNYEYHGYNNIKPLFDSDYILEFDLSEKMQVQLKNSNIQYATENYSDEWFLCGDWDNLTEKYNLIWDTNKFKELRKFVVNFYNELISFTSRLVSEFDDYIDNEEIKEYINTYLNEKLN